MFPLVLMLLQQPQLRATQPAYFLIVVVLLLVVGGVGWLIAAVLGFARSPAFGPSARWFSYAAVCLIIYHLHFLLFGVFVLCKVTSMNEYISFRKSQIIVICVSV